METSTEEVNLSGTMTVIGRTSGEIHKMNTEGVNHRIFVAKLSGKRTELL